MKPGQSIVLFLLLLILHASLSARIARQAEQLDEESNEVPQENPDLDRDLEDSEDDDDDDDRFSFRFSWNPFQNFHNIFKQMQDNMNWIYSNLFNQTSNLPEVYKNVSSEVVTIGGSKFNVSRTIIKKADNESQVIISSVNLNPVNKKKK
uniref:Hypothetical secreted protein n=1 Tax=Hottentotta judaicus TaxID=6863 RepID=F1CJ57_HOTJU|nr:hypothetical secreted protein [Hottentotta judaicus]